MTLIVIALVQLALLAGAAAALWRRFDTLEAEIARLRDVLAAHGVSAAATERRVRASESLRLAPVDDAPAPVPESEPAQDPARVLHLPRLGGGEPSPLAAPTLSPESARLLALAALAAAPAIGFFFGATPIAIVSAGLAIAAGMLVVALRLAWRAASWAGVIAGLSWALIGFALNAAQAHPAPFAATAALAGIAGLVHAHMRRAAPGLVVAFAMAAATLALASMADFISSAGAAYAALTAAAAIIGALSLRLEGLHLAAFGAALIGLFVFSGQESAAIWFTPAVALAGAMFFAIAAIRTPYLGARGAAIAGVGALAPIAAAATLHLAGHGLADPSVAAAAFLGIALALAGVIAMAAQNNGGPSRLKLTLWTLALPAFAAGAGAIFMGAPAPLAAPAFMALALALAIVEQRWSDALWRLLAWASTACAVFNAVLAAQWLLGETPSFSPWLLLGASFAAPALLAGAGAYVFERSAAPATAALCEAVAIGFAIAGANLLLRALASSGAMLLAPMGFAEAGLHIAIWLAAALLIATRDKRGAQTIRRGASLALAGAALGTMALATFAWVTPYWEGHAPGETVFGALRFSGLGFLAPAILFWAHWVFWRARGSEVRTRLALGAGALLLASFVTLEVLQAREGAAGDGADWLSAIVAAFVFALAIGINFAPGIVAGSHSQRPSYFEEKLHRHRRRQMRRHAR